MSVQIDILKQKKIDPKWGRETSLIQLSKSHTIDNIVHHDSDIQIVIFGITLNDVFKEFG